MKHTPHIAALGALLCLAGGSAQAQAGDGNVYYQVENDTASGGDPVYSIYSDVTFTNLSLTEFYGDGSSTTIPGTAFRVPLFGPNPGDPATTTLDTGTFTLTSDFFFNPDPTHGPVTLATLNGIFDNGLGTMPYQPNDTEAFDIENAFGGPTTSQTVYADFTASLIAPVPGSQFNIYAVDAQNPGKTYAAGVFSLQGTLLATPEPSPLALLGIGALSLAALATLTARRRAAKLNASVTEEGEITCA